MAANQLAQIDLFGIQASVVSSFEEKSNEELQSFIKSFEDMACGERLKLHIYACYLLSIRTRSVEHLGKAVQHLKGRVAAVGPEHADRDRRLQAMKILATWMSQDENVFDDITLKIHESMLCW